MRTTNCLTRALDQWNECNEFCLYYNGNHVISLEFDLTQPETYLHLESYGTFHFITSFKLSMKYLKLLGEYFNYQSKNVKII